MSELSEIEYYIVEPFNDGARLKISPDRFTDLLNARKVVLASRGIEDSFDIFALTFVALEEFLLQSALHQYCIGAADSLASYFDDIRMKLNLHLTSLLNASRSYEEQVCRGFSSIKEFSALRLEPPSRIFSHAYDSSLEYRVMYALRNHACHHSLPISYVSFDQTLQYPGSELNDVVPKRRRYTVNPGLRVSDLISSDKFKKSLKPEIEAIQEEFLDLKFFVRGFVAKVAECHENFRNLLSENTESSISRIEAGHHDLNELKGKATLHATLVTVDGAEWGPQYYIGTDLISILIQKRNNWPYLRNVQHGFVSSEITDSKKAFTSKSSNIWLPK